MGIGPVALKSYPSQTLFSAQAVWGPNPPVNPPQICQTLLESEVMPIYKNPSAYIYKDDLFTDVAFAANTTATDVALCGYSMIEGVYNIAHKVDPLTQTWNLANNAWNEVNKLVKDPENYLGQLRAGVQFNLENLTDSTKKSVDAAYAVSKASLDKYAQCLVSSRNMLPVDNCSLELGKEASTALLSIGYNAIKSDIYTLTDPQASCFQRLIASGSLSATIMTVGEAALLTKGSVLETEEKNLLAEATGNNKYVVRLEFTGLENSFHFIDDDAVYADIKLLSRGTSTEIALASSLRASIDTALAAKLQQAPLKADYLLSLPGDNKKALLKALGYDYLEMPGKYINLNVNKLATSIAKSTLKSLVKDIGNKLQNPTYELRRVKGKGYLITVKGTGSDNSPVAFHFWKSDQSSNLCLSYVQIDSQPSPPAKSPPKPAPTGLDIKWIGICGFDTSSPESEKYFALGQNKLLAKEYTAAIEFFNKVPPASSSPIEKALSYYHRGLAYEGLGNNQQAINDYSESIRLSNNCSTPFKQRGLLLFDLQRYPQAIKDLTEALRLGVEKNDIGATYSFRGLAYLGLEKYAEAISDFSESLKHDIKNDIIGIVYSNRGLAYFHLENYPRAIDDFTTALKHGGTEDLIGNTYYHRGQAFIKSGKNFAAAMHDYTEALKYKIDKDSLEDIYYQMGMLFLAIKDTSNAINNFSKAIELKPQEGGYYYIRGSIYRKIGESKKAAADLKKAKELGYAPEQK